MKRFLILIGILSFTFIPIAKAKEYYYTNKYGVSFTKQEYIFLSNLYFEGYQDYVTVQDYNNFKESDIESGQINIITSNSSIVPYDITQNTEYKEIKLTTSCNSSKCFLVTTLTWKKDPRVKSYDVIGAYFTNKDILNGDVSTYLMSSNGRTVYNNYKYDSNGVGCSVKLPSSGDIKVVQEFTVKKEGTINVSYQQAISNITLQNSKNYIFDRLGYGGVFSFQNGMANNFDKMQGLSYKLS